ncbi:MAG: hypothetical protein VW362_09055 [Candidatus Nanopelagicales bacterium]
MSSLERLPRQRRPERVPAYRWAPAPPRPKRAWPVVGIAFGLLLSLPLWCAIAFAVWLAWPEI